MHGATIKIVIELLLDAFAKLRKETISFVMSVRPCPTVRMEKLGSH